MMTLIFLVTPTKKRSPRKLPKFVRRGWMPMLPRSPRNPPSSPKPPCCSTANPGTTRPTWTLCSSPSRPSKWTALFGGPANLSLWATVSIDELQEKICDFEDYVQSCDVAAMNKI